MGHAVFFDFLGLYFIHYSETSGIVMNLAFAIATLILISVSIWRMAKVSNESVSHVACWFSVALIVQVISFILGLLFPAVVAWFMDSLGQSLTYFSSPMLIVGLYVCPSLIGLSLPLVIYSSIHRNVSLRAQVSGLSFIYNKLLLSRIRSPPLIIFNWHCTATPPSCLSSSYFLQPSAYAQHIFL